MQKGSYYEKTEIMQMDSRSVERRYPVHQRGHVLSCLCRTFRGHCFTPPLAVTASDREALSIEEPTQSEDLEDTSAGTSDEGTGNTEENETPSGSEEAVPSNPDKGNTEDNESNPENPDTENPGETGSETTDEEENGTPESPDTTDPDISDEEFSDGDEEDTPSVEEDSPEKDIPEKQETENPDAEQVTDTVSENTVTINSLPVEIEPVEVKDFDIVDEGGLLISQKTSEEGAAEPPTVYIRRDAKRTFSISLVDPDPAEVDLDDIKEVIWISSNPKITVTPKDGINGKAVISTSEMITAQEKASITATIGEVSRTCSVVFLPKISDVAIVDAAGEPIPESGIVINPGEQKKLDVKITPADAVSSVLGVGWQKRTEQNKNDYTLTIDKNNVITVNEKNLSKVTLPHKVTLTATIKTDGESKIYTATCTVTIPKPDDAAGLRCGDILVTGSGLGAYQPVEGKTNEWNADIDFKSQINLTYKGTAEDYTIYYLNKNMDISFSENGTIRASRYNGRGLYINSRYPLQLVLATGRRGSETYSDIYTIHFTDKQTKFSISPSGINTVPGGEDLELAVTRLPDGFSLEDITWSSGDERIVKIKEKTEKGVMLQFGQIVGTTQITATARNHRGQVCYAVCRVKLSLKLPEPYFESEDGSEQEEELNGKDEEGNPTTYYNYYWLIDKGGKVTLSLNSGTKGEIYYTTNGSDPITNGTLYQMPITINAKTKLRACAKREGYEDSEIAESEFRIGDPKLTISAANCTLKTEEEKKITVKLPSGSDPSTLEWYSSDYDIASAWTQENYNNNEELTGYTYKVGAGIRTGRCTITASINDYAGRTQTASFDVNVTGNLQITPTLTVSEGETSKEIKVLKLPAGYKASAIEWSVDNETLGTLNHVADDRKTVTAKTLSSTYEPQTLTVTATLSMGEEQTVSARCLVSVVPKQYTVSFFGWKDKLIREIPVYRGQSAAPPTNEEMNAAAPKGYTFDGWKDTDTWKSVNADVKVYAKPYVPTPYTITYKNLEDAEGNALGTNPASNPVSYTVETKQSALALQDAAPTNDSGKKFAGWYLDAQYDGSPLDEIPMGTAEDITLYAKWISAKSGQLRIEQIAVQPYTGKTLKPMVKVYDGETLLTLGTDYTVSYKNNTKAYTKPWAEEKKAPTVTIKGKGYYNGSDTQTFQILPQSIASAATEVVIPDLYLAYNKGKKLSVVPTVTWNGKKLKNNTDFKVTSIVKIGDASSKNLLEEGCTEEGEYTVTISGVNNFSGTRDIKLSVTTKTLMSKVRFTPGKLNDIPRDTLGGQTLKEKGVNPASGITLKNGSNVLTEGTHYTVSYDENAKETGTYDITFTGKEENGYAGTVTKTFKITGTVLTASKLDFGSGWKTALTYDGISLEQDLKLSYKKDRNTLIPMELGTDYTLTYENTTNVGNKAAAVITGKGNYTGVVKKTFKITPYSLTTGEQEKRVKVTLENATVSYEKGGAKPKVTVAYLIPGETKRTPLTEGKDYTVQYKNNGKLAGAGEKKSPTFTVKGKGNFSGSISKSFTIEPQDISKLPITAEDVMASAPNTKKGETIGLTGKGKYKSTPKITDFNGKALSAGTDYLKTYTFTDENGVVLGPKDQVPEGSILTVTVEGTKNYTGETKVSYRVLAAKKSVAKASVSLKKGVSKEYSLEPVTLKKEDLVVKLYGVELSGDNYTIVSYVNNRKKGTAKVTIQGVGEYGGRKTVNFKINPRKVAWFKAP